MPATRKHAREALGVRIEEQVAALRHEAFELRQQFLRKEADYERRIRKLEDVYPAGKRFGDRMRTARHASGLSQAMLARLIGVHTETIGRLERGQTARYGMDTRKGYDAASVLGVDPNWLVWGKER